MEEGNIIRSILSKQHKGNVSFDDSFDDRPSFDSFIRKERFSPNTCFPKIQYEIVCRLTKVNGQPTWSEWKTVEDIETLDKLLRRIYPSLMENIEFPRKSPQHWMLSVIGFNMFISEDRGFKNNLACYWEEIMSLKELVDFDSESCSFVVKTFLHVDLHENLNLETKIFDKKLSVHACHSRRRTQSGTLPMRSCDFKEESGVIYASPVPLKYARSRSHEVYSPCSSYSQQEEGSSVTTNPSSYSLKSEEQQMVPIVGGSVLALWQGMWFPATIDSISSNSVDIEYDDGTKAEGLVIGKQVHLWDNSEQLFPVGTEAAVISSESGKYFRCTVMEIFDDTYLVQYLDGTTEQVKGSQMALLSLPIPAM